MKKVIKTLAKKIAKQRQDAIYAETFSDTKTIPYVDDNLSDAETIPYAEPYRGTFTKKDEIYREKAKKKAIKTLSKKSRAKLK